MACHLWIWCMCQISINQTFQAALADLRIPKIEVTMAEEDEEPELGLDDDPELATSLDTSRVPVIVTLAQVSSGLAAIYMTFVWRSLIPGGLSARVRRKQG